MKIDKDKLAADLQKVLPANSYGPSNLQTAAAICILADHINATEPEPVDVKVSVPPSAPLPEHAHFDRVRLEGGSIHGASVYVEKGAMSWRRGREVWNRSTIRPDVFQLDDSCLVDAAERRVLDAAGWVNGTYKGPNLIGRAIGISREAVIMHATKLVAAGVLEGSPDQGYRRVEVRTGPSGGGVPVAAAFATNAPPQAAYTEAACRAYLVPGRSSWDAELPAPAGAEPCALAPLHIGPHVTKGGARSVVEGTALAQENVMFTREDMEIFAAAGEGLQWSGWGQIARASGIHRDIVAARARDLVRLGVLRQNPYARSYQRVPYQRAAAPAPQRVISSEPSQCGYRRLGSDKDWWFCGRERHHDGPCAANPTRFPPAAGTMSWLEGIAREVVGETMPDGRATETRLSRVERQIEDIISQQSHLMTRFRDKDLRVQVNQTPEERAMRRVRIRALDVEVVI